MESALIRLRENINDFSKTEKIAAEYILNHLDDMGDISIQELAENADVSTSSILRMARSIGYKGYAEFRKSLITSIALAESNKKISDEDINEEDSIDNIIHKITSKNVQSLLDTETVMSSSSLKKSVDLIRKSNQILLYGLGASYIAAKDLYLKFVRISKPCIINEDWHLQLISARNATPKDVAIVFSYSGQTTEIIECLKYLKENKTPIIAITRCVDTPISKLADIKLYTTSNESLFRTAAMSSRISSLNVVDILYTCYANATYDSTLKQLKKTHIDKDV